MNTYQQGHYLHQQQHQQQHQGHPSGMQSMVNAANNHSQKANSSNNSRKKVSQLMPTTTTNTGLNSAASSMSHMKQTSSSSSHYQQPQHGIPSSASNAPNAMYPQTMSSMGYHHSPMQSLSHMSSLTQGSGGMVNQHIKFMPNSRGGEAGPSSQPDNPDNKDQNPVADFQKLDIFALKRYKRHYKLRTKHNSSKSELATAVARHFSAQNAPEMETISFFVYAVKNQEKVLKLKEPPKAF